MSANDQQAPIPWPRNNMELLAALKECKARRSIPQPPRGQEGKDA